MNNKIQIQIKLLAENNPTDVCLVSRNVYNFLKLSAETKFNLHLGQLSQCVYIRSFDGARDQIHLPPALFKPGFRLDKLVFQNALLNIWKNGKEIHLGPVLGIFINPSRLAITEKSSVIQSHMQAGLAEHFLCYYFSINSIDWKNKKIKGLAFIPRLAKWTEAWFPMPDVIYDRGASFTEDDKTKVKEVRERFRSNPQVKFINNLDYIGKWKTYKHLSKYNEIAGYLPLTVRYRSFDDLFKMLEQYGYIFLKSYYGSGGKQVLSIERASGRFKLVFFTTELQELILSDVEELRKYIAGFTEGKKFIVQRGIRLLKYQGHYFDMRVLIIKDKKGQWRSMSNFARIAKDNFTITNYSAGGDCNYYENIYPDLSSPLGRSSIPNRDAVTGTAIKIATIIEREFGSFGELGMDIAIDEHGKIWFLEANTKPDKDLVEGLDDGDDLNPQYTAIFEYAWFLCGL